METIGKIAAFVSVAVIVVACTKQERKSIDRDLAALTSTQNNYECIANASWISNPESPPNEIPEGENASLCQFYQFSWQWFINLMAEPNLGERNYQSQNNYPVFLGESINSCKNNTVTSKLFVRTQKDRHTTSSDFILPSGKSQALNNAVIYDQNGNVVLYEARFDRNMCAVPKDSATLPAGTTEIKTSWRKITASEKANYIWIQSDTNDNGGLDADEIYGLVGFHLVKSTALHPEFIWATFEHKNNAPDCQKPSSGKSARDWSFASEACAQTLPNPSESCEFNKTLDTTSPSMIGTPTEICQVYAQGTRIGDNQAEKNRSDIITINAGLNIMFNLLPEEDPLAVLKHYELVGAIWENDISQPSSNVSNLRGSIQLANTTMETNAQQGFSEIVYTGPSGLEPAANCFACHQYSGPKTNAEVSHLFDDIHGK